MRFFVRVVVTVAVAALMSACAPLGPRTIQVNRPLYNEAVQQTEAQQLLLNIVRQRYNDPIMFLDVTSISSGASRSVNASVAPKIIVQGGRDEYVNTLGATYSETPIIFYAPNNGEKFVRQMLTPLDLRTLALVLQSGWSIERVLMLVGESINDKRNATAGAGPTPQDAPPQMKAYKDVVAAMRDLQRQGQLSLGVVPGASKDSAPTVTLVFTPQALADPAFQRVCKPLNVSCTDSTIQLRQSVGSGQPGSDTLNLATRSLFSAMYFLAQGVEVPAADAARGVVEVTRTASGGTYDWDNTRGGLFHVRTAATEPMEATVKVFYRGNWFYIPDTDADSKTTFALMSMLVTLQSGDTTKITPLVSLPGS